MNLFKRLFQRKEHKQEIIESEKEQKDVKKLEVSVDDHTYTLTIQAVQYDPQIPEYQGDYAKAIFLDAYQSAKPIYPKEKYQSYLLYECGIKDASTYHHDMIKEGYLVESSKKELIRALRVVDLKEILKQANKPVSGKKEVLVQRVTDLDDFNFLNQFYSEQCYSISEKGKQFLKDHEDYLLLHKNHTWCIDREEYDTKKKSGKSFYECIIEILKERIQEDPYENRNAYYSLAQIYGLLGQLKLSLKMLLYVLYFDISGLDCLHQLEFEFEQTQLEESFDAYVMFVPLIIHMIKELSDEYEDTMIDEIYNDELPMGICNKKLFLECVHSILNDSFNAEETMKKLRRSYHKKIKESMQNTEMV